MRVLVVDDSIVFRSQIRKALESIAGVEVVGCVSNGRVALQMLEQKEIDLLTLDINMPEMGGLDVLRRLKGQRKSKVRVIVFASQSSCSHDETLEALRLGAVDFVMKPVAKEPVFEEAYRSIEKELAPKIRQFMTPMTFDPPPVVKPEEKKHDLETMRPAIVVVGSSTGGPEALERFLAQLTPSPNIPILIAQHMPAVFTRHLAERLSRSSGVDCREAVDGETLNANNIYLAPGDFHMRLKRDGKRTMINLDKEPRRHGVRPAVDYLFESAANIFGDRCLGFVLTGMGEDGCHGSEAIKGAGGAVMIQGRATSVVWGMPGAVYLAGAFDAMGEIDECARVLSLVCGKKGAA